MEKMLIFAGVWLMILPRMKWNVLKDEKWISVCSYMVGLYTLIIGMLSWVLALKIYPIFFVIALSLVAVLNIIFIVFKLKADKYAISKMISVGGVIFVCILLLIAMIDIEEVASSIMGLTAVLIVLSISTRENGKGTSL